MHFQHAMPFAHIYASRVQIQRKQSPWDALVVPSRALSGPFRAFQLQKNPAQAPPPPPKCLLRGRARFFEPKFTLPPTNKQARAPLREGGRQG